VTEERFQVEWVTELSRGIEWLRDGGVRVAVLDLNLPQWRIRATGEVSLLRRCMATLRCDEE